MNAQQFFKSEVYTDVSWAAFTVVELAGMVAETPCDDCGGVCKYRGFAKEKVKGLIHRHFSICKNKECGQVVEF